MAPSPGKLLNRARLQQIFPCIHWMANYKLEYLRYDLVAGITVGLTLVPQCMAFAQIANVQPQYGLYSSFLAQIVYALMGTSRDASIGPSSITNMILVGVNAADPLNRPYGDASYCIVLSFFSGIILIVIGVLRLGFVVNLFSIPVVSGFATASGFAIISNQLKPFFGLSTAPNDTPGVFVKQIINLVERFDEVKVNDVIFGSTTIAFMFLMQYIPVGIERILDWKSARNKAQKPPSKAMQSALEYLKLFCAGRNVFVFFFTTLAAYLLCQADETFSQRTTLMGHVESGLPTPKLPPMAIYNTSVVNSSNSTQEVSEVLKSTKEMMMDMTIYLFIVPMMMMMEMSAITKSLGRKNGYRVNTTNDIIALGIGNFLQSFIQGIPSTAAVTRCALNDQCRVKTQLGSLISAAIVVVAALFLTGVFYYIPKAVLAGIIITAAINLIDFRVFQTMYLEYWPDVIVLSTTLFLCLFLDIAYGLLIMLLVNMLMFLRPVVRTEMQITHEIHQFIDDDGETRNKMTVVKLSHGMKYPSADKFLDRMSRIVRRSDKHVVLDCQFITGIDYTGLQALRGVLAIAFEQNKHIIFTNLSKQIVKEIEAIGLDHWTYVDSVNDAVDQYNKEVEVDSVFAATPTTPAARQFIGLTDKVATRKLSGQRFVSVERPCAQTWHAGNLKRALQQVQDQRNSVAGALDETDDEDSTLTMSQLTQQSILKKLKRPAYFYHNIPFTVGSANVSDDDNEVGSGREDRLDDVYEDVELTIHRSSCKSPMLSSSDGEPISPRRGDPQKVRQVRLIRYRNPSTPPPTHATAGNTTSVPLLEISPRSGNNDVFNNSL